VPSLDALLSSDIEVAAVVTNPDRPAGRGMELRPSPVKVRAEQAGLEVLQPEKARDEDFHERVRTLAPDVATVVAYGKILPVTLLEIPPLGFVNVHFSLLPLYRGAAPVQRAVMEGRTETGVSIMILTEGMDEGPVLAMHTTPIGPEDTAGTVGDRLADEGADLLVRALQGLAAGTITPRPQDDERATYAPKITPDEARIDWSLPADRIDELVRGLNPVPGAWTELDGRRLKVWKVQPAAGTALEPGALATSEGLVAGTGTTPVALVDVQLQGKKRMSGAALLRGLRVDPSSRLG